MCRKEESEKDSSLLTSYLLAPRVLLLEIYVSTYPINKPEKTILTFAKLREILTKYQKNAAMCRKEGSEKDSSLLTSYLMAPIVLLLEIYASTYPIIKSDKTILTFAKLREKSVMFC